MVHTLRVVQEVITLLHEGEPISVYAHVGAHICLLSMHAGFVPEPLSLKNVTIDRSALAEACGKAINDSRLSVAMILIRRVDSNLYYRYLGNQNSEEAAETWSSSKIFCESASAQRLRGENCTHRSGLDSFTDGKHGPTPLGDLSTVIASYDETAGYTSNSLAAYFGVTLAGKKRLGTLVDSWLNAGQEETLGGHYGEDPPSDLANTSMKFSPDRTPNWCTVEEEKAEPYVENHLSPLTAAEWLRRLVLHRETSHQLPGVEWDDVKNILYGATNSTLFGPTLLAGGMTVSTDLFVQSGVPNMTEMQHQSGGAWRLFSKLGAGYSSSRHKGEILTNAYACLPVLQKRSDDTHGDMHDASRHAVAERGVEFVLSARASVAGDTGLVEAQRVLQEGVSCVTRAAYEGKLFK